MIKVIILYFFSILYFYSALFATNIELSIATSPKQTSFQTYYYDINKILINKKVVRLKNVLTDGSVENIGLIVDSKVDLALIQSDTVFLAQNGLFPFSKKYQNFSTLMPINIEPIYLITNNPDIYTIEQLTYKKVNVGLPDSGLLQSVKVILGASGKWDYIKKYKNDNSLAIKNLLKHKIDAVFVNEISPSIKKLLDEQNIYVISLSHSFIKKLQKTYPHFIDYSKNGINTVATITILIVRNEINEDLVFKIAKALYENPANEDNSNFLKSNKFYNYLSETDLHNGALKYFNSIKINDSWLTKNLFVFLLIFFIFIIFLWIIYSFIILKNNFAATFYITKQFVKVQFNTFYKIVLKYKYYAVIVSFLFSYILILFILKYFEHTWAIENNYISKLDGKSIFEILRWMFVFSTTGIDYGLQPKSKEAQILVSFIPIINTIAAVSLLGIFGTNKVQLLLKGIKGMKMKEYSEHIIICGWNEKGKKLINELTHENLVKREEIVILTDDKNEMEALLEYNISFNQVTFVHGNALTRKDLALVNPEKAKIIIVLAQQGTDDSETIIKVLNISKTIESSRNQTHYIIAEIKESINIQLAQDAGAKQVISIDDIEAKIFIQSVRNPGVSKFIDEVFEINEENDFYPYSLEHNTNLIGKTYDEILIKLRKNNILLLSINIEENRSLSELKDYLSLHKLNRSVITNPFNDFEKNYKVTSKDSLILLAQYEKDLYNIE